MDTRSKDEFVFSLLPIILEPIEKYRFIPKKDSEEAQKEIAYLRENFYSGSIDELIQQTEEGLLVGLSTGTVERIKKYLEAQGFGLKLGMEFQAKENDFLFAYFLLIRSFMDEDEDSINKMIGRMQGEGEEPEKQEEGASVPAAQSKGWKTGICPHCDKPIEVVVKTTVEGVGIPAQLREELGWKYRLNQGQIEVVERARENGILANFEIVVKALMEDNFPRSIEQFFIAFLKTAVLKMLPPFARRHFSEEFGTTDIKLWSAQGIGVVTADDVIRVFIPTDMLTQKSTSTIEGKVQATLEPNLEEFSGWIRTKFGYVVGKGEAFENMRKKSIGEFARPRV